LNYVEEDDEDVYMLDSEDDARDKDYVAEEEEEEMEEEPGEEDVAKEVEELVKSQPQRKGDNEREKTDVCIWMPPTVQFWQDDTTVYAVSSSKTSKPKELEMSEINLHWSLLLPHPLLQSISHNFNLECIRAFYSLNFSLDRDS